MVEPLSPDEQLCELIAAAEDVLPTLMALATEEVRVNARLRVRNLAAMQSDKAQKRFGRLSAAIKAIMRGAQ